MSKLVLDVTLQTNKPTQLTFRDLYTWIIWQYPHRVRGGYCGAICPPIEEHGWWAAIIFPQKQMVIVCAHLDPFPTPEAAIQWGCTHLPSREKSDSAT